MLNAVLRLRRDNDYNYAKIKDKFIPANGEICLIDTANAGLRAVCGDGKTPFGQLEYLDSIINLGYYFEGQFYSDRAHTKIIPGMITKLYIDLESYTLYFFSGTAFFALSRNNATVPDADTDVKGIMKLYDSLGNNTDGTISQKAITDELDDKVELTLNTSEEMLIFTL